MNYFLIGMPGCGKSKTAKYLQIEKSCTIIDLDKYIEEKTGMNIPKIFEEYGESYFRTLETKMLKLINEEFDNVVVSCGGGIVVNPLNKEAMKNGLTIFLNANIDTLKSHLENSCTSRPLLKVKTIEELYNERFSLYLDFADYTINYTDFESVGNKIMEIINNKKRVLVINGPNLNMLGLRDPNHYGTLTLDDINKMISEEKCFDYEFFQSNHEGAIVDKIQQYKNYDAIIINPAAYTHTSVAIHDALEIVDILKVEVHLSEVDSREDYRKVNFVRDVVDVTFQGEKAVSYLKAVGYLKNKLNVL